MLSISNELLDKVSSAVRVAKETDHIIVSTRWMILELQFFFSPEYRGHAIDHMLLVDALKCHIKKNLKR